MSGALIRQLEMRIADLERYILYLEAKLQQLSGDEKPSQLDASTDRSSR